MDKISKALSRLTSVERNKIKKILQKIAIDNFSGLDIKKLKSHDRIFRIRSGSLRIIFRQDENGQKFILAIARRNEKTYKKLKIRR